MTDTKKGLNYVAFDDERCRAAFFLTLAKLGFSSCKKISCIIKVDGIQTQPIPGLS